MNTYSVERDFPLGGKIHRKGGEVSLTNKQARHLRIAGFIKPKVSQETPNTGKPEKSDKKK